MRGIGFFVTLCHICYSRTSLKEQKTHKQKCKANQSAFLCWLVITCQPRNMYQVMQSISVSAHCRCSWSFFHSAVCRVPVVRDFLLPYRDSVGSVHSSLSWNLFPRSSVFPLCLCSSSQPRYVSYPKSFFVLSLHIFLLFSYVLCGCYLVRDTYIHNELF